MNTFGVVGLGMMGEGIAKNLAAAGYETIGVDASPAAQRAAEEDGVRIAQTGTELALASPDAVVIVVRTDDQVRDALFGADGVATGLRPGVPVIVASTVSPTTMAELAGELREVGLSPIGAGLSGGPWGAQAGTLTWAVAGPSDDVQRVRPVFEATGTELHIVGEDPQMAHAAKLAVQLIYGVNMFGVFEALRLGSAFGIAPDDLVGVLVHSVADSWVARNWPHIEEYWREGGNGLDILVKDMRAATQQADQLEISLPVTTLSFDLLRNAWHAFGDSIPLREGAVSDPKPWATRADANS